MVAFLLDTTWEALGQKICFLRSVYYAYKEEERSDEIVEKKLCSN